MMPNGYLVGRLEDLKVWVRISLPLVIKYDVTANTDELHAINSRNRVYHLGGIQRPHLSLAVQHSGN
jgi:hypothetical protein